MRFIRIVLAIPFGIVFVILLGVAACIGRFGFWIGGGES